MKKFFSAFALLTLMVSALSLSSCDGIPAQGVVDETVTVIGTWKCTSADFGSMSGDLNGMINEGDLITLKDDNTYYLNAKNLKQTGTWSLNGKKLKVVSPDLTMEFNITELTSSKLSCYLYIFGSTMKFSFARQ